MSKIKIFVDSASDITKEEAEKYNITVIPLTVTFDGVNYFRDFYDMDKDEFYEKISKSSVMPKTSQVTPAVFKEYFERDMQGYDSGICVLLSSISSGTYQSAVIAANDLKEEKGIDIEVIDSKSFSYVYGGPTVIGAKMAQEGKDKDEIIKTILEEIEKTKVYFLVDDIEYLKKGGRINTATLVIGKLLDIRPVLTVKDGLISACDKIRGSKKIYDKLLDVFKSKGVSLDGKDIVIINSCIDKTKVEEAKAALNARFKPNSVIVRELGATIGTHTGTGVIAYLAR